MDYVGKIKRAVSNLKVNSPVILISDAVVVFKKMYSGPIKVVNNAVDVRDLVAYYYGIKDLSHPLIIEDVSNLSSSASFMLLKLVEEAKFPIILLSSFDKISPILLSRCKVCIKFSLTEVSSQFMPAYRGKEAMDEYLSEDSEKMDKIRWMRDNSPMLYYYMKQTGDRPNIDKMLNILM